MARLSLWDELRATRNPSAEETVRLRLPGILTKMNIHWTAYGYGDLDTDYSLDVVEEEAKGLLAGSLVARSFRLDPSMHATLSSHTPAHEDYDAMKTIYIARLAAGELTGVQGWTLVRGDGKPDFTDLEPEAVLRTPPTMTPSEALAGFEISLDDAHFY